MNPKQQPKTQPAELSEEIAGRLRDAAVTFKQALRQRRPRGKKEAEAKATRTTRRRGIFLLVAALGAAAAVLWKNKGAEPPEGQWRDLQVIEGDKPPR